MNGTLRIIPVRDRQPPKDCIFMKLEIFVNGPLQCNAFVLFNEGSSSALIIDPGQNSDEIMSFLEKRKLKPVKLIHTHGHIDHIGASRKIKDQLGIPIYLHEADKELYENIHLQAFMLDQKTEDPSSVDVFLKDGDFILCPELSSEPLFRVLHTPGHSQGSVCFYSEILGTPILISGDTLFRESVGRTDLPGGNSRLIVPSIKNKLLSLPPQAIVYPGHGPSTTLEHERDNNYFLTR